MFPETGETQHELRQRWVTYVFGELDTLVTAYAATIHKTKVRCTPPWLSRS
jgi:hypothetical protein